MHNTRRLVTALSLGALVALSGCTSGPEFAEVEGVVSLRGKPLPEVEIVFSPMTERGTTGPTAACVTDAQGRYRLKCERAGRTGALVGTHRVVIRDIAAMPPPPGLEILDEKGQQYQPKPLRVPDRYTDLLKTPFQNVEVHSGKQTLDYDLK
jgi:hypothetical protein